MCSSDAVHFREGCACGDRPLSGPVFPLPVSEPAFPLSVIPCRSSSCLIFLSLSRNATCASELTNHVLSWLSAATWLIILLTPGCLFPE